MANPDPYIIIGAGHGSGQAAASLRAEGYDGPLMLIGQEPYLPYQRPPLSKKYLAGELEFDRLYVRPQSFYDEALVDLKLGIQVTSIDRSTKTIATAQEAIPYEKLLLTTGSRVRRLRISGSDLEGVKYLRTIADVDEIRPYLREGVRLCVVGGGYIGLEVAAVAIKHGLDVSVVEAEDRVMSRVVSPEVSAFFETIHTQEGVHFKCGHGVSEFVGNEKLTGVKCANGAVIDCDIAIVGIGIVPNDELAKDAGLETRDGIVVDEYCRTADPDIFAAGDCTRHPNSLIGRELRLESVHNALEQAKTAAAAMCGTLKPYAQIPWFWSDQYDLKLQIAGLSQGYDQIVMRRAGPRKMAAFYLKEGVLIAVDAVNSPPEYMVSRKLIEQKAVIPPDKLADPDVPMKEISAMVK